MAPTGHDIEVATDALRSEAGTWAGQARAMSGVGTTAAALAFDHLEAGIFAAIVSAHAELAAAAAARCGEGAGEMDTIAATLSTVAAVYDDEERRYVHALRNLY